MATYNSVQGRADVADAMMPDQVVKEIIKEAPQGSAVLSLAKHVPLSSKKAKQPVLSALPEAYWVDGDTGMKQTTKSGWKNSVITAEELAAIVPIPDALVDDTDVPLWDEIKPLLVEALGKKVDDAALFGIDKPESWPTAVVPSAVAAQNVIKRGTGEDFGVDVASLAAKIAQDGFAVNGFASKPGLQWELIGLRSAQGVPIYTPALAPGQPAGLYGYQLNEVSNGSWNPQSAELIAADWSKMVVGIRQDVTFDLFSEGVISDENGKVILNLMQQDTKALRVVFRVGFQVQNPVTRLQSTEAQRYPAGVIVPKTD